MKVLVVGALMAVLMAASVSAVTVDCKSGWWDTDFCQDHELQDEFDTLENWIVSNHYRINHNGWLIAQNGQRITQNAYAIQENREDIDRNTQHSWANTWMAIGAHMKADSNSEAISQVDGYVSSRAPAWNHDSDGARMDDVVEYAMGEFLSFLKGLFVQQDRFDALEDRVYLLEAENKLLKNGAEYSSSDVMWHAVVMEADDKGASKVKHGDYSCIVEDTVTCIR